MSTPEELMVHFETFDGSLKPGPFQFILIYEPNGGTRQEYYGEVFSATNSDEAAAKAAASLTTLGKTVVLPGKITAPGSRQNP